MKSKTIFTSLFVFFLSIITFNAGVFAQSYPKLNEILDDYSQEEKVIDRYIQELRADLNKDCEPIKNEEASDNNILKTKPSNICRTPGTLRNANEIFTQIKEVDNKLVRFFVQYYTTVGRAFLVRSFKRLQRYFPIVERYANKYGLPPEVAILGIIESGYVPYALSPKGAKGIWQLMPLTAQIYGIRINSYLDERMDIEKSTRSSFLFLKSLSDMFNGNWELMIAGYNGGGGYISSQMRRFKENNFWTLCQRAGFKSETLEFVPRFYAVLHIIKNAKRYGLEEPIFETRSLFTKISSNKVFSLDSLSRSTGIPKEVLTELNPHFTQKIVLRNTNLYIPATLKNGILSKIDIIKQKRIQLASSSSSISIPSEESPKMTRVSSSRARSATFRRSSNIGSNRHQKSKKNYYIARYRVRRGDTIKAIAKKYGVSSRLILSYNGISSAKRISKGKVLRIPVKQRRKAITLRDSYPRKTILSNTKSVFYYRIKNGDTLYSLARKYNVSLQQLKQQNRLSNNNIYKGQKIKLIIQKRVPVRMLVYKTQKGDSLYRIARKFNTSAEKIASYNESITKKSRLIAGQIIYIPES